MQSSAYNSAYDDYSDYRHHPDNVLHDHDEVDVSGGRGMLIVDGEGEPSHHGNGLGGGVNSDEDLVNMNSNSNSNMHGDLIDHHGAAAIDFDDPKIANLPRILLMGPRRGGKTSIQRVVFQKMSPHETLFRLEATQQLERTVVDHTPLCRFTVWDFPGDYYGGDDDELNQTIFAGGGGGGGSASASASPSPSPPTSLVFVVDAQDEPYDHVLQSFTNAVTTALALNPSIVIEVFINKVDGELFLSDESKYDCRRDIMTQVTDELADAGVSPDNIHIRYHLTSIYDHSKYEALSRVVQRLIPQLPTLENLLNILVGTCSMEKAYLFDVVSKLYIGTDPGPVDMQSVELCSDMIDVVLDVSGIYGLGPSAGVGNGNGSGSGNGNGNGNGSAVIRNGAEPLALTGVNHKDDDGDGDDGESKELVDPDSAYDYNSASVIRLSNGMVLYLKEVDTMLALVCITRAENFRKKSLINYNIGCLKKALRALVVEPSAPAATENGGAV